MPDRIQLSAKVGAEYIRERLDAAAADLFPQHSRSTLQAWIRSGDLRIDGRKVKASQKLRGGEKLEIDAQLDSVELEPESMALDVRYEDADILVLNKPAGLVVHPGAGNRTGTLLNGLLAHDPSLSTLPRGGIVHRLDKDTTGLMVVARSSVSYLALVNALSERRVSRIYEAVVHDAPGDTSLKDEGTVEAPVGRHPVHRTRMAVVTQGKHAISHYRLLQRFDEFSHVRVSLETGRTHQIRVHMQHLGHPLVGDPVYGKRTRLREELPVLGAFSRQALHAASLSLAHPSTGKALAFRQPLPDDMVALLEELNDHAFP